MMSLLSPSSAARNLSILSELHPELLGFKPRDELMELSILSELHRGEEVQGIAGGGSALVTLSILSELHLNLALREDSEREPSLSILSELHHDFTACTVPRVRDPPFNSF